MPDTEPYSGLPNYDPHYCLKVARWSAAGCLAVLAVEILVLLIVEPSASCPGWKIQRQDSSDSLWLIVLVLTAPMTAWMCCIVLGWDQTFSPMIYDSILHPRSMFGFGKIVEPSFHLLLDFDRLFLRVCISWCLFSAFPLGLMLFDCTNLPTYLR